MALIGLACLGLAATLGAVPIPNEFWLAPIQGGANLGTLTDPFCAFGADEFDYYMNYMPSNATIHILPGTYSTRGNGAGNVPAHGGWMAKSGQKIIGSGIDVTILKLVPGAVDDSWIIWNDANVFAANMEVRDLTLDCNYTTGATTYHGVVLYGDRNAIRRVKLVHAAKFGGNSECFGIGCTGSVAPGATNSTGNIIEDCEVSGYLGGGPLSAICMYGSGTDANPLWTSGVIRNNRVYMPNLAYEVAINLVLARHCVIEGNYSTGGFAGVYGDTYDTSDLLVAHNSFVNVKHGVIFDNGVRRNLTIAFNRIELNPALPGAVAVVCGAGARNTNIVVLGNTIRLHGPSAGQVARSIQAHNTTGLTIANNAVDSTLPTWLVSTLNVQGYNNTDLSGAPLDALNFSVSSLARILMDDPDPAAARATLGAQAASPRLDNLAALAPAAGNVLLGSGVDWFSLPLTGDASVNGSGVLSLAVNEASLAKVSGGAITSTGGKISIGTASSIRSGQVAHANGNFAVAGDAQSSEYVLRGNTTTASQSEIFLNNVSARLTIPAGATWAFRMLIAARSTAGNSAGYEIKGLVENHGGNTTLVGTPAKTTLGEDVNAWDAVAVADNAADALEIKVTGSNGQTVRWVATVRTTEVAQ